MIKTLDKYIVRTFLNSLAMWFVVFMVLRIVIHMFIKMDEFTEGMEEFAERGSPILILLGNIISYYFFNSFVYFTEMGGIIIVVAAAFSVARLNHTNELTAMLASGVSLHRVVWPIILSAMLMGGLIIVDQEFIIPAVRDKLIIQEDEAGGQRKRFQVRFLADSDQSVWWSANYDPQRGEMSRPLVILRDFRDNKYIYQAHFNAECALPAHFEGKAGWMAEGAELQREKSANQVPWRRTQKTGDIFTVVAPQKLNEIGLERYRKKFPDRPLGPGATVQEVRDIEAYDPHFSMKIRAEKFIAGHVSDGKVVTGELIRPKFDFMGGKDNILATIVADRAQWAPGPMHECHWKLEKGGLFHATDLSTDDLELRQSGRWMDYLSSSELTRLLELRNTLDRRAVRLTKYIRFADPLNNLVMLLLGLPFILSRQRNLKASAGLCVLIVGAFYVFIYICRYLGLPDFWAAFLPVLLFGPVSVLMLDSIKT